LYYRATLDNQRSGKLEPKWKGPYVIYSIIGNGAYRIQEYNGRVLPTSVNGSLLKLYKDRSAENVSMPLNGLSDNPTRLTT
jgi:hypothetical protein